MNPISQKKKILITVGILIIGLLSLGGWLSFKKVLWTDEIFTQIFTVDRLNYGEILSMKFSEGNLCPLFYVGQKAISDIFHHHLGFPRQGEWCLYEPYSQFVMRILPNVYMVFGLVLIFVFLLSIIIKQRRFFLYWFLFHLSWFGLIGRMQGPIACGFC